MSDTKEIANRIKSRRTELRLRQQELADKVGVSLVTITRWENPESGRSPNSSIMPKLAEALSTTVNYLMGVEDISISQERLPNPEHKDNLAVEEKALLERNPKMATFTSKNGEHFEAPATPEGYAFLERMLTISMGLTSAAPVIG